MVEISECHEMGTILFPVREYFFKTVVAFNLIGKTILIFEVSEVEISILNEENRLKTSNFCQISKILAILVRSLPSMSISVQKVIIFTHS